MIQGESSEFTQKTDTLTNFSSSFFPPTLWELSGSSHLSGKCNYISLYLVYFTCFEFINIVTNDRIIYFAEVK